MAYKKYICPKCGRESGVRIVYGYPGPDLCKEEARGKIELGGCCINMDGSDPDFHCKSCGHEWRFPRKHARL